MRLSVIILVSMPKSGTIISVLILSFVIFAIKAMSVVALLGLISPALARFGVGPTVTRTRDPIQ